MLDSLNPRRSTTPVSVLVVDDEPSVRDFLSRILAGAGYCVGTATNGDEALAFTPPDVLLTDVVMPHMTGEELARRMRERDPNVRVLYVTGHSAGLFTAKGLLWEGEAFLDKPVTAAGVIQAIDLLMLDRRSVRYV